MKSTNVVLYAERDPVRGVNNPSPNQIYKNPRILVEERDLGALTHENIRVEMMYAGICGTDVHLTEANPKTGYSKSSAPANIPSNGRIIGHEGVGKVLDVGDHVKHIHLGDYVTFESIIVCHHCDVCRRGQFNQCRSARLLGLEEDGLFGTIVDVPAMLAHDVSDIATKNNGLMAASCIEPAGVAYVACQNTCIKGGDVVAVFGAGPIGLLCAVLSQSVFGASEVHIIEPLTFRREFARKWCQYVYDVDEYLEGHSASVDVVIEASGQLDNIARLFRRINANGRIALLARSGNPLILNAVDHMITNQISLIGSRGHLCGAFSSILNLYKTGRLALDKIVTDVVDGPEKLAELLQSPREILDNNCKILVHLEGNSISQKT